MRVLRMTEVDLAGKRVLIREDLNVPVQNGVVTSDARIRASLPTIEAAQKAGARVMLMSHLGRPEEGVPNEEFSLAPVAARLSELLGRKVRFERDWLDGVTCEPGEVVLLENVRFNKGEKKNKDELAQKMAALCDVYVMDAFATAHRAEASTHGVGKFAPVACAGPLLTNELDALEKALSEPKRPLVAIVARLEGLDQAHRAREPARQGRQAHRRRRHRQHVSRRARPADRQVAARGRHGRHGARAARALEGGGVEIPLPTDVVVAKEFAASAEADVKPVAQVGRRRDDPRHRPGHGGAFRRGAARAPARSSGTGRSACSSSTSSAKARASSRRPSRAARRSRSRAAATRSRPSRNTASPRTSRTSRTAGGAFLEFLEGKKLPAVEMLEQRAAADRCSRASRDETC